MRIDNLRIKAPPMAVKKFTRNETSCDFAAMY